MTNAERAKQIVTMSVYIYNCLFCFNNNFILFADKRELDQILKEGAE